MAGALVCQASTYYLGIAYALGYRQDDSALDGRSRVCTMLWRPLLAGGLSAIRRDLPYPAAGLPRESSRPS